MNNAVKVNEGTGRRDYLDGERSAAGAIMGYAHLELSDVIDDGEGMVDFFYQWKHVPSGKTGIKRAAFFDEPDFRNYLALWNAADPQTWNYAALSEVE